MTNSSKQHYSNNFMPCHYFVLIIFIFMLNFGHGGKVERSKLDVFVSFSNLLSSLTCKSQKKIEY